MSAAFDHERFEREMQERLDELFYDRRIIIWARATVANLPTEAMSWDRRGGYWLCVFTDPHPSTQPSAFKHFMGDEYLVWGLAFALETEADLAGWAWERMLRDFWGCAGYERDPNVLTPVFVRAEWFPGFAPHAEAARV